MSELTLMHFGLFYLTLVATATLFAPLQIRIAYLNSQTLKTENSNIYTKKFLDFCANQTSVQFWLILPKFGCHGISLCSVIIPIAYLNLLTQKTLLL